MEELKNKFVGKFIGPNKIVDIEVTDQKTKKGSNVFKVILGDMKETMIIPEAGLVTVITDKATDYNHIRDSRVSSIIEGIHEIVQEYDLPASQIPHLAQMIATDLSGRFDRATVILWHGDETRFVPGFDPYNEISVLMAEGIITNAKKNESGK